MSYQQVRKDAKEATDQEIKSRSSLPQDLASLQSKMLIQQAHEKSLSDVEKGVSSFGGKAELGDVKQTGSKTLLQDKTHNLGSLSQQQYTNQNELLEGKNLQDQQQQDLNKRDY
eukprot:403337754